MDLPMLPTEFHTGLCFDAHHLLGAHPAPEQGPDVWLFRLWAPSARRVQVFGDFNSWSGQDLARDAAGVWSGYVTGAQQGQFYKYNIQKQNGDWALHTDPYGFYTELRPGSASVLWGLPTYKFQDKDWIASRSARYDQPLNIYELHAGSWKRHPDGRWYTCRQLAGALIPWLKEQGYNFIELLPLAEHPFDGSWGYQCTGYFSVTSRYGTPEEFAAFVDACHQVGIGVLMDFVPVHFACNGDALARLDGTHLYEYDSDVGLSEWGSYNFNLYRGEVRSFLNSAAAFWLEVYHCDGLRMDAVSRALYWQGDDARGVNQGAVKFLQTMNQGLHQRFPGVILAAEDSTNYLKVTAPVQYDGLGFDYKWDMGWMNDTLRYFSTPFDQRPALYHSITFSMEYFYNELYLLALSHDEVVHGKHTLIDKMWGSYEEKFAQARLLQFYFMLHPGKKLSFMGTELAHFREWDESRAMDWCLLEYPMHQAFLRLVRDLNRLYLQEPALFSGEYHSGRFQWITREAVDDGVFAFTRTSAEGEAFLIVLNTQDKTYNHYPLYFDNSCHARLVLSTDSPYYGGSQSSVGETRSIPGGVMGKSHTLYLDLPALSGSLYRL